MDLQERDLDLLKHYADQLVNLDAKRRLNSLRESSEQQSKRIRREAAEQIATHPENFVEIEKQEYEQLQRVYKSFWDAIAPEMLEWFSKQDFHVVYLYMKEIWPLNEILRNDIASWRQRLILEYPDYWLVNAQGQTGNLRESTVQELLSDATQGSGPRSRPPTEQDAMYLLYQKARRLTRFISKAAASGSLNRKGLPRITAREVAVERQPMVEEVQFHKALFSGRHFVTVLGTVDESDDPDVPDRWTMRIVWFDLGRRQSYRTEDTILPATISGLGDVQIGENALIFRWNLNEQDEHINVFNLNSGQWIFDNPVIVGAALRGHDTSIVLVTRANEVVLLERDQDDYQEYSMLLTEFIAWVRGDMANPPAQHDNGDLALRNGLIPAPAEVFLQSRSAGGERWLEIFGRWIPRTKFPDDVSTVFGEIVSLNFHNSYTRPVLMRYGPRQDYTQAGGPYITDGVVIRRAEPGKKLLNRDEETPPPSAAHSLQRYDLVLNVKNIYDDHTTNLYKLLLRDRSDEINSNSAMMRLDLEPPTQELALSEMALSAIGVIANYVVFFVPMAGRVLIYDLWDLYKLHRETKEEREHPLLSKPLVVEHKRALCNLCSSPANGVCSECKRVSYCSAKCAADDLGEHMVACVNKS